MRSSNNFNAQRQVVFVEPTWVTGETCLYNITNKMDYLQAKSKLTKLRKDFLLRLEQEGFVITLDKKDITDESVCLIMNDTAICDENIDISIYKKQFDNRMFEAGEDKLNYPYSLTVEEYFEKTFLPAVFKNEATNGGVDKFLIETPEQVEIIKKLYEKFSSDKRFVDAFNSCIFQQLIETPTKYETYMRVLMSASGDVMGASLKYSKGDVQKRKPEGLFEQFFLDEKSEYFLNCNSMFNYYSDGGNISFPQPRYSSDKQDILKAHGIDPNNPTIPSDVLEVASSIVQNCNQELGIMCGFDFILNEKDNKWYYLENQAFPAIEEWAVTKRITLPKGNSINDYIKYLTFELEARYDALIMYMNKKQCYKGNEQEKVKVKF